MKNNKKIDIDAMFSQFREESQPTPIQNLIEARPSGALFALKTSISTSFTSVKMWIGMACLSALVTTGIVYNTTNTTTEQPVHSVATKQLDRMVNARTEAPLLLSTPESAEHAMTSAPSASIQNADMTTVPSRSGSGNRATGIHTNQNDRTVNGRKDNQIVGKQSVNNADGRLENSQTQEITTARYHEAMNDSRMESVASFVPIEEKFPFPESSNYSSPRKTSLMINGLPLLADIVQFQGEFQISDDLSCGLLLGAGNVQGSSADISHLLLLAGAQCTYYLLGDFEEGLQVGAQALYSSTSISANKTFLYENGRVLSLTPYAGYKLVLTSGLTMNVQAGVGASTPVFVPTEPSSDPNTVYKWHVSTRMHLNIGWSL